MQLAPTRIVDCKLLLTGRFDAGARAPFRNQARSTAVRLPSQSRVHKVTHSFVEKMDDVSFVHYRCIRSIRNGLGFGYWDIKYIVSFWQ